MASNKDVKISKPEEPKNENIDLKEIEKAIGGDVENTQEPEETKTENILGGEDVNPKDVFGDAEEKDEDVFEEKGKKQKDAFRKAASTAAATAALKAAIDADSELAVKNAEKAYFIEKKNHMLKKCKKDKKVGRTISKFYAPYLGKVYTFLYNGIPVTIYCDGKEHMYPEFIAKKIDKKLLKIADSNTYKEIIDERLEQDTF